MPAPLSEHWRAWCFAPVPATRLALVRVIIGVYCLVLLLVRAPSILRLATLPASRFEAVGVVRLLSEPLPPAVIAVLLAATSLGALAFTLGWRWRATAPAFALALLILLSYRNSWGHMSHSEHLVAIHVLILALAPAADALSLDARAGRRRATPQAEQSGAYGWPLRLLMLTVVLHYMLAGWAKLAHGGWAWLSGESVRNQVAHDALRKLRLGAVASPFARVAIGRSWIFAVMASGTVLFELGAVLALADRPRLRLAWVLGTWTMHLGIAAAMAIVFPYPVSGVAFVCFFPLERTPRLRDRLLS